MTVLLRIFSVHTTTKYSRRPSGGSIDIEKESRFANENTEHFFARCLRGTSAVETRDKENREMRRKVESRNP